MGFKARRFEGVKSGQVYQTKAAHGHRYVRITSVRGRTHNAWATWVEVTKSGALARTPRQGDSLPRTIPGRTALVWNRCINGWQMPGFYSEVTA